MGQLHRNDGSGRDERPRRDDADVVEALRHAVPDAPPADVRKHHLAAIAEAAAAAGHEVPDTVPAGWVQRWGSRARRVVALTAVKVGLSGAAVALAAGGGLAATGNLPDPAQRVVADVAERVGVDLPHPDTDRVARSNDPDRTPERPVVPRVEGPASADERADRTVDPDRVQDQQRPDEPGDPDSRPVEGDDVEGEDVRENPPASDVAPVEPGVPDHAEDDAASSQGDESAPREERPERQGTSGGQQAPDNGSTSSNSDVTTEREDADASDRDSGSAPGVRDAGSAPAEDEPDLVNP